MQQCTSRQKFDYIIWTGSNKEEMENFFLSPKSARIEFHEDQCHINSYYHLNPNCVLVADVEGNLIAMPYEQFIKLYQPE